jgi:5,10-methylenetetrahydromethanopterin reductase
MTESSPRFVEIGSQTFAPPLQGVDLAVEAEDLGYDFQFFGVNECQTTDVFTELRMAVEATTTVRLGCSVANFVTRHPSVVASAIAAIQLASDGRAICAVGKGDSAVGLVGRTPQRHEEFAADLVTLSTYLAGGTVKLGTADSQLRWLAGTAYTKVPVEVAGSGPRSLALAGAVADRVSLAVGADPGRIRWATEVVYAAADAAGRKRSDIQIGAHVPVAIDDSRAVARDELRPSVIGWAHMASFSAAARQAQDPILRRVTDAVHDKYDYRFHSLQESKNSPLRSVADDEFVDYYGIAGPPSYVCERLLELMDIGLRHFTFVMEGEQKARLANDVAPVLRSAAASSRG